MAGARDIKNKIRSVQNTQKITRAMEMVAASKMRKAQERMAAARPYAEKMRNVIAHASAASLEYRHPFLVEREMRRVGVDRGVIRPGAVRRAQQQPVPNPDPADGRVAGAGRWSRTFCIIGNKGASFFARFGINLVGQATHVGDAPAVDTLFGVIKVILDAYTSGRVDRVFMVYNQFVNSMTQRPVIEQLLPREASAEEEVGHYWDYIYEPDSKAVLDIMMTRYIESLIYQAVVENVASEQAARMVAMKAASDNAGSLIDELLLAYNKARQASITQELSEIVGGAAAL